jgi:1,4-alpha-glucan branching enzyme
VTVRHDVSRWTDFDVHLFREGRHFRLWEKLGSHPGTIHGTGGGVEGTHFAVWAPNARHVSVIGEWNSWQPGTDPLAVRGESGVWEGFIPEARRGQTYKYRIESRFDDYRVDKADPFAFTGEAPPGNASRIWDLSHEWGDGGWMGGRSERQRPRSPISIYEMHLGSWRRPWDGRHFLGCRELAEPLADHLEACGFSHVELLPVMEHPYYGSWGYQTTGYFAATERYGTPQDLMALIDHLHRRGFGVILDWVPSHFATDGHSLGLFDGTHLYEHADPRRGSHPDWGSYVFNYGRNEVVSFLVSSALFWLDRYHADGLRVDAVASMLYLDYSREEGEWVPNRRGGREDLEAVAFLRTLNQETHRVFPDALTVAEESTAWPGVTAPVEDGGLGFDLKWDLGWMHDTLRYLARPPVHRKWHHDDLTFRGLYMDSERYCLPLSHDEVVHGKRSLLSKMPGDEWQMRANLRLLFADQLGQPGKKLLFMGAELGTWWEWSHEAELPWHLVEEVAEHAGLLRLVGDLNRLYRNEAALHDGDVVHGGFEWIDADDAEHSVFAWLRWDRSWNRVVAVVLNATPEVRAGYRLGLPRGGGWCEALNTDAGRYGGSGVVNPGGLEAREKPSHGRPWSVELTLPPLGAVFLTPGPGD